MAVLQILQRLEEHRARDTAIAVDQREAAARLPREQGAGEREDRRDAAARGEGRVVTGGSPAELKAQVDAILPRVFEFSELLIDKLGVKDVGAFYPHTVTLHSSCHALRSLHIGTKPAELLKQVKGLTLLELPDADQCCGFGGTFAVKNPDVSAAMLSDKLQCVLGTKAEACTGADNSCLMHIGGALSRQRTGVRTIHLAEILASTEKQK
jgi:L-lactate dehydrogenase complex protein LldE